MYFNILSSINYDYKYIICSDCACVKFFNIAITSHIIDLNIKLCYTTADTMRKVKILVVST